MNRAIPLIATTLCLAFVLRWHLLPPSYALAQQPSSATPPNEVQPQHPDGQRLLKIWQTHARNDGKIPGALIGELAEWVKYFIELNDRPGESITLSTKFKALLPRFVATQDWTQPDAIKLVNDISAIHRIPLHNALDAADEREILPGEPLPDEFADAPWGKPVENGLRVAWLLEPRATEYRLGTSLKSRILIHNSGPQPVFFIMPSWQQTSGHTARSADGAAIEVTSTYWTTMARMKMLRLAPGAYYETPAPGIGVGGKSNDEDWANVRPGAWIMASEGDDVRLAPGAVEVRMAPTVVGLRKMNNLQKPKDAADLWQRIVKERVDREAPLPRGAADREQLLRRIVRELYGVEPNQGEIDAYVRDQSPGGLHPVLGLDLLKTRVMHGRRMSPFIGTLPPGEITFRVLSADPDAAKRPRVATGPGYYILGDQQRLHIEQSRNGDRRINTATIRFFSAQPKTDPPGKPRQISLPDGRADYAIAWNRDADVIWIAQRDAVKRFDFSDPADVKEARFAPSVDLIPEPFRAALQPFLPAP